MVTSLNTVSSQKPRDSTQAREDARTPTRRYEPEAQEDGGARRRRYEPEARADAREDGGARRRRYELKARAEAQEATRARIAAAAASLHEEVGVARTTVADIARRAGVQRLTVYNHFPDLEALLPACSAHFRAEHPQPDLEPALALEDPAERLRAVLTALYGWYRETAPMQRRVFGERATVPELDAWIARSSDPALAQLAARLAAGFDRPDAPALVALALDFWTWQRLEREGLDDAAAAALMTGAVRGCGRD
jgi:AcrR family transcriptional regulator